ncbi:MAG: hypothetical protein F6K09_05265 [Merismopedia sp. SIO2A8]|nr:hypothetical protein [Merismopedia sp. SIO2A8]
MLSLPMPDGKAGSLWCLWAIAKRAVGMFPYVETCRHTPSMTLLTIGQ